MVENAQDAVGDDAQKVEMLKEIIDLAGERHVPLDSAAATLLWKRGTLPPMLALALTEEYARRYPTQPAPSEAEQVLLLKELTQATEVVAPLVEPDQLVSASVLALAHAEYTRRTGQPAPSDYEALLLMQIVLEPHVHADASTPTPPALEDSTLREGWAAGGGVRVKVPKLTEASAAPAPVDVGSLPLVVLEASSSLYTIDQFRECSPRGAI